MKPFELKILPSCPLFRANRVRPYRRPMTKKEAEEAKNRFFSSLQQAMNTNSPYNCGLYPVQQSSFSYTGKPGWWR